MTERQKTAKPEARSTVKRRYNAKQAAGKKIQNESSTKKV